MVIDRKLIASVWGARYSQWVFSPSWGSSGGVVVLWNTQTVSIVSSVVGVFLVSIQIEESTSGGSLAYMVRASKGIGEASRKR